MLLTPGWKPCDHREVCMRCALQVEDCPMCRRRIQDRVLEDPQYTTLATGHQLTVVYCHATMEDGESC
ncbi:hypothetical protein OS493_004984 [Desmophyllum pertusum]|uniref:RING-type domain-containing protein n=1 Tax=Desmophyllum pertusum TaxID=174260 RepID=A0A9W9Z469_9CNID|nr:hypothetical protein OS493_004984 [Desmophyllum pertusum]